MLLSLTKMKKIGITEPTWSPKVALQKQIEREDLVAWAQKPVQPLKYEYKSQKFELSFAAKEAFTRGISFFKL